MQGEQSQKIIIEQLSQDLEDLEDFLRDLWGFLPLPACYVNPLFKILDVNSAFENLFGWKFTELIGEGIELLFAKKRFSQIILKSLVKKKRFFNKEGEVLTKEGEKKIVNISASARRDSKGLTIGYYFTFSDISELKKLQARLEEQTGKLRELTKKLEIQVEKRTKELEAKVQELENSRRALINMLEDFEEERRKTEEEKNKTAAIINNFTDGLLLFDTERVLRILNPQAEIYFEIKSRDVVNKKIPELKGFPKLKILLDYLEKRPKRIFREELKLEEDLIVEVSSLPIVGEGGREIGTLIILHDITREKRVERMKSQFVSIAAHQLRTPLSILKWSLDMLKDGDIGKITEEQKTFVQKIYITNERMIRLVNDLLNVARIEEGRYVYQPKTVNFIELVENVFESLKSLAKKRDIEFKFIKPRVRKPPIVKVDVEKIILALRNLTENALLYTEPKGRVEVKVKKKKREVEFSVKDTGIGIPKTQQDRVFSKFFRGGNVVRMETEGTGLGLFITKNIIEAHRGKIWFQSKEGKGSTFFFTLPLI
jgi:PAS domain S-box-containing protein